MFLVSGATNKTYEIIDVIPLAGTWISIRTTNERVDVTLHVDEVAHVAIERFEF